MRVLLTNDDGVASPGLLRLREILEEAGHEVWTVAPDGERSGMSNYITLTEAIRCEQVGERSFAISGSPADCVIVALLGAIPIQPEVVISGINIGPNLGTDIIYSGTAAGARQAAYKGIPGIAVSLDSFVPPLHFAPVARFIAATLAELMELWNEDHFININAPNLEEDGLPVRVTRPSVRRYDDKLHVWEPPRGGRYFFVDGRLSQGSPEAGTDWHAIREGAISISPVLLNPVNHTVEETYQQASFIRG
ncbi:MAG: 5'/3'-nucleotidase SurE [Spirochaetaceae bacterium]